MLNQNLPTTKILLKDKDRQIADLRDATSLFKDINEQLKAQRDENLPDFCPSGRPNGIYQIKVKLSDVNGNTRYDLYDDFSVGSEDESYKLNTVGKFSGTAGDSLTQLKWNNFTTSDRGNLCEAAHFGGWWRDTSCVLSLLNGKYYKSGQMQEDRNTAFIGDISGSSGIAEFRSDDGEAKIIRIM
ncbi:ficolin-1-A-like [Drosophila biarmipes]|uniref:ficolin-1-A-like n=1 Tax=Drosophila biarmipes TaxID=125945 RepID=UPI0007E6754E|nr:ficolin-1-A-like [Drosophila biarmipes]